MNVPNLFTKLVVVCCVIAITGCKKEVEKMPTAAFDFNKSEYVEGETINLINHSENATRYRWTFPEGNTGSSVDANYPIPSMGVARTLTFKLESYSETGQVSDYIVKNVWATPSISKLVLYHKFQYAFNVEIYIDGVYMGNYTLPANPAGSVPPCDSPSYPTLKLKPGTHVITVGGNLSWTKSLNLQAVACTQVEIDL